MARIQHRKQREDESVQSFADEMIMLLSQIPLPESFKRDMLLDNLKPSLRKAVLNTIPETVEEVIKNAAFLEERVNGITPEKIKNWEQQRANSKQDPMDRLARQFEKMQVAYSKNVDRQENQDRFGHNRPAYVPNDRPRQTQRSADQPPRPIQCWKCKAYGHKANECTEGTRPPNYARAHLPATHDEGPGYYDYDYGGCVPTTTEAAVYAAGQRPGPLQRTPKNWTPWSSEGIKAARDARANRGNAAASGSGAAPTPARPPRAADPAPRNTPMPAAATPRDFCRGRKAVDIISHLENTPMKMTYGAFLQEAPGCREELIQHLENIAKPDSRNIEARTPAPRPPAPPRPPVLPSSPPYQPRPFTFPPPPPPPKDNGPTPMETNFETEAFYHTDAYQANSVNAVCKGEVNLLGKMFECIIDTGASDIVLSHSVVRKLGLMDKMVPSHISFLTAAGKTEKPMGMLPDLPVQIGTLTLHILSPRQTTITC